MFSVILYFSSTFSPFPKRWNRVIAINFYWVWAGFFVRFGNFLFHLCTIIQKTWVLQIVCLMNNVLYFLYVWPSVARWQLPATLLMWAINSETTSIWIKVLFFKSIDWSTILFPFENIFHIEVAPKVDWRFTQKLYKLCSSLPLKIHHQSTFHLMSVSLRQLFFLKSE